MVGSGMEWAELATVDKECQQLYEKYKEEEWICDFNKHFAPLPSSLKFLMEDLEAGIMASVSDVARASDSAKHPPCKLAMMMGVEHSEGCGGEHVAGSVAKGLVMLPRVVTTPKSKGKGKAKAREEEEEEDKFEDPIEDLFTNKCLASLLQWRKALMVVDTGMGTGVVLKKAKEKSMVSPEERKFVKKIATKVALVWQARRFVERQRELAERKEPIQIKHSSLNLPTLQDGTTVGGSGVIKSKWQKKSHKVVESEEDASNKKGISNSNNNNDMPLAHKQAASLTSVSRQEVGEEERDVKMREKIPLAMVTEVEPVISRGEVGKQEVKEGAMKIEKDEESEEESVVQQWGIWSSTLLHLGNNELKWLGEDLALPTLLMLTMLLCGYNERAAGVEKHFRRELERVKKEFLNARARFAVAKRSLATVAGYWGNCQAFLAWQEVNGIGKED
ncbi:hypothetical protein E4T56_gene991 [Termitomyces sp. T112]|nr:hypothetical protein E4T56_gene991 [Termitomyces sp. T112]